MSNQQKNLISKEMTIAEIFEQFPDKAAKLASKMQDHNLNCVGCSASTYETLEAGMASHGFDDDAIDQMVADLQKIVDEKTDLSTISITPAAAEKFKALLEKQDKIGWGLRLADRPAGCSGFEYSLDFSKEPLPTDKVFTSEGINIHVNEKTVTRMLGSSIDFVDSLSGSGFKISNPNVKNSCGCGKSQSY